MGFFVVIGCTKVVAEKLKNSATTHGDIPVKEGNGMITLNNGVSTQNKNAIVGGYGVFAFPLETSPLYQK